MENITTFDWKPYSTAKKINHTAHILGSIEDYFANPVNIPNYRDLVRLGIIKYSKRPLFFKNSETKQDTFNITAPVLDASKYLDVNYIDKSNIFNGAVGYLYLNWKPVEKDSAIEIHLREMPDVFIEQDGFIEFLEQTPSKNNQYKMKFRE